jgi:hypothetical protein
MLSPMAHPFISFFDKGLKKSTSEDNVVLQEALKLREKGYRDEEVGEVLRSFAKSLVDDREAGIAEEALEEFLGEEE